MSYPWVNSDRDIRYGEKRLNIFCNFSDFNIEIHELPWFAFSNADNTVLLTTLFIQ